jgi:hypothetical protein
MSAFCPDDGRPPRLIRYAPRMPLPDMLTLFFKQQNLLIIDKEHWQQLDDDTRERVLRSEDKCLEVYYPPNKGPVVRPKQEEEVR